MLLCSDGLSDVLTSAEIGEIVEHYDGEPARIAQTLVDAANESGGKDNVSVIFVAGAEFLGSASRAMSEARSRHAITRQRRRSRSLRIWLGRVAWLVTGMILGAVAWALIVDRRLLP